ncbi:MAG: DUF3693 domain-containing protein [Sedimenticola sp.]
MNTIYEYVLKVAEKHRISTVTGIAKHFGKSRQYIYKIKEDPTNLSDEMAIKIEQELDLPNGYMLALLHAERSSIPGVKKAWSKLAKHLGTAASVMLLTSLASLPSPADASAQNNPVKQSKNTYILC